MPTRDSERMIILNKERMYKSLFDKRFIDKIEHYETAVLRYPTQDEINEMDFVDVIWKTGQRYSKLAHEYYGNSHLWWVIGWFNKKPIDAELTPGDLIRVPLPLEKVLSSYGY
jgi:hypothetical protein